jgi:hypothetical protein
MSVEDCCCSIEGVLVVFNVKKKWVVVLVSEKTN